MANTSDILKAELEDIKRDLIRKHLQLGMKASGNWIKSLEVQVEGLTGIIFGEDYTEQLVNGREPGRFPPISKIEEWIKHKNISITEDLTVSSLAFLIARKIANEGTDYFKQGGTDLIESVITPQRIQKIIDKVSDFQISRIVSEVTGIFEEIAA